MCQYIYNYIYCLIYIYTPQTEVEMRLTRCAPALEFARRRSTVT